MSPFQMKRRLSPTDQPHDDMDTEVQALREIEGIIPGFSMQEILHRLHTMTSRRNQLVDTDTHRLYDILRSHRRWAVSHDLPYAVTIISYDMYSGLGEVLLSMGFTEVYPGKYGIQAQDPVGIIRDIATLRNYYDTPCASIARDTSSTPILVSDAVRNDIYT